MYKWGIGCMIILLVAVLAFQYYVLESFEDLPPAPASGMAVAADGLNAAAPEKVRNLLKPELPLPDMPADDARNPEDSASGIANEKQKESKLIKDVMQMLKSEINSNRIVAPMPNSDLKQNPSPLLQQGAEYVEGCPKMPDMSQYIRKDQIPCWNCNVDY